MKEELEWLRSGAAFAAFLHLASARQDKLELLLEKNITAIAYEQIQEADGTRPVLRPLSQIGGTIAAQTAARLLQNKWGGRGILLGMIPGVPPAEIVILGAGVAGTYAARAFRGLGAHVTVLDKNLAALQDIAEKSNLKIIGVNTGLTNKGIDLGSNQFVRIDKQKVAMIIGNVYHHMMLVKFGTCLTNVTK